MNNLSNNLPASGGLVNQYYQSLKVKAIPRLRPILDKLNIPITADTATEYLCNCPHHKSLSKKSLQVNRETGDWNCFGCNVGGDIVQLQEFVVTGHVEKSTPGHCAEAHRISRNWLADFCDMPHLQSPDQGNDAAEDMGPDVSSERVSACMMELFQLFHNKLLHNQAALQELKSRYALSDALINSQLIGYGDLNGVLGHLTKQGYSYTEILATGAFYSGEDGSPQGCHFADRLVFPYMQNGRAMYGIARETPWTKSGMGKYVKSLTYSKDRTFVSKYVHNVIFNIDCLTSRPKELVITEGITDTLALVDRGFAALSPATVCFRKEDKEFLISKLKAAGLEIVYICQDNEISNAGLRGAKDTAIMLRNAGIEARIAILPLGEKQIQARAALEEKFGIKAMPFCDMASGCHAGIGESRQRPDTVPEEGMAEYQKLLADAKLDINEFFFEGHTGQDFQAVLLEAKSPTDLFLDSLLSSHNASAPVSISTVGKALMAIAQDNSLNDVHNLAMLQSKLGTDSPGKKKLKAELQEIRQTIREHQNFEQVESIKKNSPTTCKELVAELVNGYLIAGNSPDYIVIAEKMFEFLKKDGAFFGTTDSGPLMVYKGQTVKLDPSNKHEKRILSSELYTLAGLVANTTMEQKLVEVLANKAAKEGVPCGHLDWIKTDIKNYTVYLSLNDPDKTIIKITPKGIERMPNGVNSDSVLVTQSPKMPSVTFNPDAHIAEVYGYVRSHILKELTCASEGAELLFLWLAAYPLKDFASTVPMTRNEGPSGSAKTGATKLLTALLYKTGLPDKATEAACYAIASENPLVALDNIECKNATQALTDFLLTNCSKINRQKCSRTLDTGIVQEQCNSLVNMSGIEPFNGNLLEVQSRTLSIPFGINWDSEYFESDFVVTVEEHRDEILSAIYIAASHALSIMSQGRLRAVIGALRQPCKDMSKERCVDYLGLMYLLYVVFNGLEEHEGIFDTIDKRFLAMLAIVSASSAMTQTESNPIVNALELFFGLYSKGNAPTMINQDELLMKLYNCENHIATEPANATAILTSLNCLAKRYGLSDFQYNNACHFSSRLNNDTPTIEAAGFKVIKTKNSHKGTSFYSFVDMREESSERSEIPARHMLPVGNMPKAIEHPQILF